MFRKNPYKEILVELEEGLWEHDFRVDVGIASPYEYDDETFKACCKIFMSAMMYKLWNNSHGLSMEFKEKEAEMCGNELKEFVYKYTGIDTHQLYVEEEGEEGEEVENG